MQITQSLSYSFSYYKETRTSQTDGADSPPAPPSAPPTQSLPDADAASVSHARRRQQRHRDDGDSEPHHRMVEGHVSRRMKESMDQPNVKDSKRAANGYDEDAAPSATANRILSFVRKGIANAATPEEKAEKLDKAREGIEKGFAEARDVLTEMGVLQGRVAENIDKTYKRVMKGLDKIAAGIKVAPPNVPTPPVSGGTTAPAPTENVKPPEPAPKVEAPKAEAPKPPPAAPAPAETPSKPVASPVVPKPPVISPPSLGPVGSYTGAAYEAGSLDLKIRTAEGDEVTIKIQESRGEGRDMYSDAYGNHDNALRFDGSSLKFSVKGNLNSDELKSIASLLGKVEKLSESFFGGNLQDAFKKANELGIDDDQLSAFSLDMSHVVAKREIAAYQSAADDDAPIGLARPLDQAIDATGALASTYQQAKTTGLFADPAKALGDMLESIGSAKGFFQDGNDFLLKIKDMLTRLAAPKAQAKGEMPGELPAPADKPKETQATDAPPKVAASVDAKPVPAAADKPATPVTTAAPTAEKLAA